MKGVFIITFKERRLNSMDKSKKVYMLVLYYIDGTDDTVVEFVTGQKNVRRLIINVIDQIDIHSSFVLVDNIPFGVEDGKPSVYQFMTWIKDSYNDGFDIEEYNQIYQESQKTDREFEKLRRLGINGDLPETYQNEQIISTTNPDMYDVEELR